MKVLTTHSFEKIQAGDISEFEKLFRDYYEYLCRQANSILKDPDEAEEIVQETFVKIWNKRQDIEIKTSVKNYLIQSIKNQCFNHIKHAQIKRNHSEEVLKESRVFEEDDSLVADELSEKIERAINKLPEERKKIFIMSRHEGLKYKEIADQLGISIKTVENQMGKALKTLREELTEYLSIAIMIFLDYLNKL